jgi:hypothetical protein
MVQNFSALVSALSVALAEARAILLNSLGTLVTIDARSYQPEKYYMRGPGPKWREKHASARR